MSAPGAILDLPPESPDQLAARLSGRLPPPAPAPIPPELLAGPGAGTILPPGGMSSPDIAAGIMARQPNAVTSVPPPMATPALMDMRGIRGAGLSLPPAPAQAPMAPPVAGRAPAVLPRGGGAPRAPGTPADDLERQLVANGKAGAAGIEGVQGAKAEGAEANAAALGDLAVEQRAQAQQLADKQVQQRQLQTHLDEADAANLKKARDYTIPDFWKGAEGARVGSILSIAMGNISAGILGGPNAALQIVNKNVDDYGQKQKEKIDNLYKYAEQTGRLNDKTRMRYAQELTDLQAQHTAIKESVLTRIKAVEQKNLGNVDRAQTASLISGLEKDIIESREKERANRAQIVNQTLTARANAAQSYAAADASRASAAATRAGGKANKGDDSLVFDVQGRPFVQAQTPQAATTFRKQQQALTDLGSAIGELEQNYKQGVVAPLGLSSAGRQRDATMSRIVLAAKTVGELGALSGPDMGLVQDLAGGKVGHLLGSPEGITNLKRLHQNGMTTALSQIGAQPTPENLQRFQLAPPAGAAQGGGLPSGLPQGAQPTGRKTKDGRAVYQLPGGQLVAG